MQKTFKIIYKKKNFKNIFISEKIFYKKKKISRGVNPGPGRNLLHTLDCKFIFEDKKFVYLMQKILGANYRVLDYKLVMGIPKKNIPNWILKRTMNFHSVNLGKYIKEEHRDLTYFKGIDFHQDIIDFPDRDPDFITAYIYLDKVDTKTTPL